MHPFWRCYTRSASEEHSLLCVTPAYVEQVNTEAASCPFNTWFGKYHLEQKTALTVGKNCRMSSRKGWEPSNPRTRWNRPVAVRVCTSCCSNMLLQFSRQQFHLQCNWSSWFSGLLLSLCVSSSSPWLILRNFVTKHFTLSQLFSRTCQFTSSSLEIPLLESFWKWQV